MRATITFDEVSVSTTKTLLQLLAGTNRELKLCEVGISFKGTNNLGEPILVQLIRQTTAGTATARTLAKSDESDSNAIDASGQTIFTAEPTAGDVLRPFEVHPQTGLCYLVPDPPKLTVKGGNRVGLRVVTPGAAVSVTGYLEFEE